MDNKKKIVLATSDIVARRLEDIYIDVSLKQTFNIIKRDRFDNNFDLAEQFRKERNASRSFRVYGIIDSVTVNCDSLTIDVYSSLAGQTLSGYVATITSEPIGFGDRNVFGKMRGKYIIELNDYEDSDSIYLHIQSDNLSFEDIIVKQQLVFKGSDGEFMEYGTDTLDIGMNGEFTTINNDFPFFYNKHWIKNNFQLEEVKLGNIRFEKQSYSIDEGDKKTIVIELSKPSVFGIESVDVELVSSQVPTYDEAAPLIDFKLDDHPLGLPITLNWAVGEKNKEIDITAIQDYIIEKNIETFVLKLTNPINSTTDKGAVNVESTVVSIVDKTPRTSVIYNLQKIVNNIFPVEDPKGVVLDLSVEPGYSMNTYGAKTLVLSGVSGSEYNSNYRFFPNDNFSLEIKNEGEDTVLPVVPGITTSETGFKQGESVALDISSKYQNSENLPLEQAVLNFNIPEHNVFPSDLPQSSYYDNIYSTQAFVNGLKVPLAFVSAKMFVDAVVDAYEWAGIEIPFDILREGRRVTLTAKHPANNINVLIPKGAGFSFEGAFAFEGDKETPEYPNGRVSSITSQVPFEIKLFANNQGATACRYSFRIKKQGFEDVFIPAEDISSSLIGEKAYLVTKLDDVRGPSIFNGSQASCDYSSYIKAQGGWYANGAALKIKTIDSASSASSSQYISSFRPKPLTQNVNSCGNIEVSDILS